MFKNYLKISWRNLFRNRWFTLIKVLGLAVGVTCAVLIALFVNSEWSYDRFHAKEDRLYRMWQDEAYQDQRFVNAITPMVMAPTLQANIPEVEATCRIIGLNPMVNLGNQRLTESVLVVDSTFFDLFDFPLASGNRNRPFPNMNSVILSESAARKYFGDADPRGQEMEMILGTEPWRFTVSGVVADAPEASSIQYQMLIPYETATSVVSPRAQTSWYEVYGETYVLLRENASAEEAAAKFPAMMQQALGENYTQGGFELYMQPIAEIHLDNTIPQGIQPISDPKYSYILVTIGLLILLVACANFIILSVGQSGSRAREVGVRKVMGAERKQLIGQFMGEAFLIASFSLVLGVGLAFLFLQPFNSIISRSLVIPVSAGSILFCLGLAVVIAGIAGFYPALVLSRFNPASVLKGQLAVAGKSGLLRRMLVVGQFTASIALIVCAIFIGRQLSYFQDKDMGYSRDMLLTLPTNMSRGEGNQLAERFRTALLSRPEVSAAGVSLYSFAESPWVTLGFTDENQQYSSFQYNAVDPYFLETMGVRLKDGRLFDPEITADQTQSAVVNEAFAAQFGLENPIGKKLPGPFSHRIIGVVRDFNFQSLHTPVAPLVLTQQPDSLFNQSENVGLAFAPQPRITVRLQPGKTEEQLNALRAVWADVAPDQDFSPAFLDESLALQYQAEQRTATITRIASGLSVFIAVMGLFALVTLTVARRRKEIGIRRVLGAGAGNIVRLLSGDYLQLIALAALIAFPLSWWFMNDWLQDFAYRIPLSWWVFGLAGVTALGIALLTVSFQALRAARSNPVNSLRTE